MLHNYIVEQSYQYLHQEYFLSKECPIIASLLGQITPGKVGSWTNQYKICTCIEHNIKTIAFPFRIGCGLAQGNWKDYEKMLLDFTMGVNRYDIKVYL